MAEEGETVVDTAEPASSPVPFASVEFEIFGLVQGLGFPKSCKDLCDQAGLSGWVKNSKRGTIVGKVQGPKTNVEEIVKWLSETGCPGCRIDRADIHNWEFMSRPEFRGFCIRF